MGRPPSDPTNPLRVARVARGLSLDEAAGVITRSPATLARYEAGKHMPPRAVLVKLGELYGVDPNSLLPDEVHEARARAVGADLLALGQRLPADERGELHRIVGELFAVVTQVQRLVAAHG